MERKRSVTNCKMPRIPAGHMRIMVNPRPFPRERGVAGETKMLPGFLDNSDRRDGYKIFTTKVTRLESVF